MKKFHPNHIVDYRPWPILSAFSAFSLLMSIAMVWHNKISGVYSLLGFLVLFMISIFWCNDIFNESSRQGIHSKESVRGFKLGIVLFIGSEVFFFVSFFWAFFRLSISPGIELGGSWPPAGVERFDPFMVPLLNTLILVSSGATLTWSHNSIHFGRLSSSVYMLFFTIVLGAIFTFFQGFEYWNAGFRMSDSSMGSTFFLATGFHGLHVLIGTRLLLICLKQLLNLNTSYDKFVSFDASAWYWHFVDVVWLFLFSTIYWWGS